MDQKSEALPYPYGQTTSPSFQYYPYAPVQHGNGTEVSSGKTPNQFTQQSEVQSPVLPPEMNKKAEAVQPARPIVENIQGIPDVGFYIPPAHPQESDDDREKLTPFHDDIAGFNFNEKSIRLAFIRKVFALLSMMLTVTCGSIALFLYHEGIKVWTQQNSWFIFVCFGLYIVTAFTLICCESVRRRSPQNYIFLALFTFATSLLVGLVTSMYEETSVLLAAGVTVVVCVSLTIFAFQTKIDFTRFGGILFVCLIVLILFGFMTIFLRSYLPVTRMIYAGLGALLFSAYLVHDVQLLIGGDHKYSISPEEYVFAALTIFLDIINIFLMLLRIFGHRN